MRPSAPEASFRTNRVLGALASLRLTVALLSMGFVLIFVGTLAQVEMGVWQAVDAYFRSPIAWLELQLFVPRQLATVPGSVPFPGGLLIGSLMIVNLLAAHTLRFRMVKKRIGIVVLHAGLIVLLAGEFATAIFAEEGLMSIDVGGSSRHVEDLRAVELAIVDPSDPEVDRVTVVPEGKLIRAARHGKPVMDEQLPFAVEVLEWMPNARLWMARGPTQANRGVGMEAEAEDLPRVRGVDGAQTDAPAAYIRLTRNGEDLGVWLVWANLIDGQRVEVDGRLYGVSLRYKRTYKAYELHLNEFRHDKFVGTEVARNFSSHIRLTDPSRGTDRDVVIWMNNPLRYAGATFYQASYKPDGSGTVLQVVRNPGAALPYVACALVTGGMLTHFLMMLTGYMKRENKRAEKVAAGAAPPSRSTAQVLLPWAIGALGLLITLSALMRPPAKGEFDIDSFSRLPVSSGGRVKPMDSTARHVLSMAGGRQSVRTGEGRISASQFLIDLVANPNAVRELPVIRVDHPDVLALLQLAPEQGGRISFSKIEPHWQTVTEQAIQAHEVPAKGRDPFQRAVVSLHGRVNELLAHASMMDPYSIPPYGRDGEWEPFHTAFLTAQHALMASGDMGDFPDPTRLHPAVAYYTEMMNAYSQGDAPAFNRAVAGYKALLERDMPSLMRRAHIEVLFHRAAPFLGALTVYIIAFLLLCGGMLWQLRAGAGGGWDRLRGAALGLLCAGFIVHTLALVLRIYLQGRPPVTNLYSSAVFVGWAAVLLGLVMERLYPLGMAALGATTIGTASLIVAHNLGSGGDTMQMMQAVLDSNFWLATHVITITLGYSTTFLAGALGMIYLLGGVLTKLLTPERSRALARMVYAAVAFSLLLSFVGTVLGGIWADQSWGRFWGWDPKENGAALVVLINAIILHARWGGMIRERGIMVLAVAGNIVTAWSWFGTNMLGIGLHAYGFMDSGVFWLMLFVSSQLVVMGIGLVPMPFWRSKPMGHSALA